ncbi:MAG: general secretion pathway protein GspD [Bdellovibrionaceae bacterium]|nr:general secretion pathway protein GspD [Pseudobdellovibrionaceae bacterium]
MKYFFTLLTIASFAFAKPTDTMKMNFINEEILKIIESYSKTSGQKFVVDPGVRGKISIFIQEPVSLDEAFNQLSSALAINGYGISKQGDTMIVKSGRNIQRDLIEVSTQMPIAKPERMYSWIYTFKNISAESVMRDMRILPSKDGEMNVYAGGNQIIITDWTSNLNRIAAILKEIDKKPDPEVAKIIDADRKGRAEHREFKGKRKHGPDIVEAKED